MTKRVPRLRTNDEAEAFLDQDLSDYIQPEHMVPLRYETLEHALLRGRKRAPTS